MLKSILAAGVLLPSLAFAAPFSSGAPKTFPLLSGTYVITINTLCQIKMTDTLAADADTDGNAVTKIQIDANPNDDGVATGTANFVQGGGEVAAGTMTLHGTIVESTSILLKRTGNSSGTQGGKLKIAPLTGTLPFTQTVTALTIQDNGNKSSKYKIFYGNVSSGIAHSAFWSGIDDGGCAQVGTAALQ